MTSAATNVGSEVGSAANVAPVEGNGLGKKRRALGVNYRFKNNKKQKTVGPLVKQGSNDEVLAADIQALIQRLSLSANEKPAENGSNTLPEPFSEIELTVAEISSTGDGLAMGPNSDHVYIVPFTSPGDKVKAKVIKHFEKDKYSLTDFLEVIQPGEQRDDSLINCQYFATCSGCQFQMLPYSFQLAHKKTIVEKAYKNFSELDPSLVPAVQDTIGSPLQYGYRTKLTPHFDGPPDGRRNRRHGVKSTWPAVPPIGFMKKGTRHTIDIEDCPIGTEAVRKGMARERKRVAETIDTYQRGATLLLRENTERVPQGTEVTDSEAVTEDRGENIHVKTCITKQTAVSTEWIDDFVFTNPAGAFFQNNNSILPVFTQYIRDRILPPEPHQISNLIDAYSGSGLFTITLSSLFKKSLGIDISSSSISFASENAKANNLDPSHASFIAADASNLFASITFPANETVVVIDPPRKGCDESFLKQLLQYAPERVIYVSCNVHTQARDVGVLVKGMAGVDGGNGEGEGVYEIESLRGFDFFPQTGHVEGVAVLRKKGTAKV